MEFVKMLRKITPKKFLCRYPLHIGAISTGIILICVSVICTLTLVAQAIMMASYDSVSSRFVWRNAFSYSLTGVIYSLVMLAMHIWLLWGVKKKKKLILLTWFVITAMWLAQTFILLITLICLYSFEVSLIGWIVSLVLGLIAIGILIYLTLNVYGLWLELKTLQERSLNLTVTNNNGTNNNGTNDNATNTNATNTKETNTNGIV